MPLPHVHWHTIRVNPPVHQPRQQYVDHWLTTAVQHGDAAAAAGAAGSDDDDKLPITALSKEKQLTGFPHEFR